MSSSHRFAGLAPAWRSERILHEDPHLLVVDKPAGLPTAAPESGLSDAVSRLREHLAARGAGAKEGGYLGVQQPLERDVSGVLLLSRSKAANAALAPQFERHAVRRVFLAAVLDWPEAPRRVPPGVRARVLERSGARSLVELAPERGGAAAVRAHIAALGAVLAGDPSRREAPAARVLLHLASLSLAHPGDGRAVTFTAPEPPALRDWVRGAQRDPLADERSLDDALADAADARHALFREEGTDAFRIANAEGDGLPGLTVDRYGDWALVQFYSPEAAQGDARERVLDAVARTGARGVYAKFRPRQANTLVDTRRDELAPARALRGEDAPEEFTVREAGLAFRVRLGDGLSTGIFLDQRENRRRVRELSRDRAVLNLFAYTGPFTVAAAAGGARATVTVDVSPGALAWARRNLEANDLARDAHDLVAADVFGFLHGARARRDRFDLVILDPPSYSTTKDGSRFSSEADYRSLAAAAMAVVAPGGHVLACSNHRGIPRARFRRYLHEAARDAGRAVQRARDLPDPIDFPPAPGAEPHLKSVLLTLA